MRAGDLVARGALAILLLAMAASAHADYKNSYALGLEAYKSGKNSEAKALFQAAQDEHPEPAQRILLYGKRFDAYVPQHYLGLIAAAEHDCAALQKAQGASATEQIAAQLADLQKLPSDLSGCAVVAKTDGANKPPIADAGKGATIPPSVDVATNKSSITPDNAATAKKSAPPEALQRALDDYLIGHYESAARIDPLALPDPRARFHAYLVRSASEYTLSRLSNDSTMHGRARADAAAARAIDKQAPDEVLFSPDFRKFFVSAR